MNINELYCIDNVEGMKQLPDNFVDLTVTSPPYDGLRTYNGYSFDFENVAKQLFRVTKEGGVVVWVVGDSTLKGSETGTSFRQVLYFKEVGFNLHDTMIYHKNNPMPNEIGNRYQPSFEYMFILSKRKPKTFNPILEEASKFGKTKPRIYSTGNRQVDGRSKPFNGKHNNKPYKFRHNVWNYNVQYGSMSKNKIAHKHPAIFPEQMVEDHVRSWSNEGDLVFDPFVGSGTTSAVAKRLNRNYLGFDISQEYIDIANKRING